MAQHAAMKNRAPFSFLLKEDRMDGSHLLRKKHLLKKNMAGKRIAKSVKSMKVALTMNWKSTKDAGFYLDSAADVHITYNHLLFSKYSEV